MRIDISKLKEGETMLLEHEYDPKVLQLELYDLHYRALLKLKGKLERLKDSLFFRGSLTSELEILCTRCLKPVYQKAHEPFDLYYPYREGDTFLETTDEIREVMILSYPAKFLCEERCKGLCGQCGANLNEGECRCLQGGKQREKGGAFEKLGEWYKTQHDANRKNRER